MEIDTSEAVRRYLEQRQPGDAARASMSLAVGVNPDQEAEYRRLAQKSGIPVDAVRAFPNDVKQTTTLNSLDYGQLAKEFPTTAAYLGNIDNARIAHDDVDNMSLLESMVASLRRGVPGLAQDNSATAFRANINASAQIDSAEKLLKQGRLSLTLSEDPFGVEYMSADERAQFRAQIESAQSGNIASIAGAQGTKQDYPQSAAASQFAQAKGWGEVLRAFLAHPAEVIASMGPENLLTSAPGLLAGIVGGPGALGLGSFATDYGSSLLEALGKEGVDIGDPFALQAAAKDPALMQRVAAQAIAHAAVVGPVDALSGGVASKLALPAKVATQLAKFPLSRELAGVVAQMPVQGAFGAAGEAGGELAAGQPLDPQNIVAEFVGEMFGTPFEVASLGAKGVRERITQAREANANAALLTRLNEVATASKVRGRDTSSFTAFMEHAAQDGPVQDLYIDQQALQQSGVDVAALTAASPSVAAQLADAVKAGTDIRIPVSEFATNIAGEEFSQSLIPHLKTDPAGMSQVEADAYMQSYGEDLRATVAQTLTKQAGTDAFRASRDTVQADMLSQLTAANVHPDAAKLYSALVAARYGTLAHQLGVSPEEAYALHPINVSGKQLAGDKDVLRQDGSIARNALAIERADQTRPTQSHVNGSSVHSQQLADIFEGVALAPKFEGALSGPALARVLARVRSSVLKNPEILDSIVKLVPVDVVNHLFGSQDAAKVALRDQAMLQHGSAVNAELPISGRGDAAHAVSLLLGNEALMSAEIRLGAPRSGGGGKEAGPTVGANQSESFRQGASPAANARALYVPSTKTIVLLNDANLTSVLHELGHAFLDMQAQIAAQPNAPQAVVDDMNALLDWFGVKATPEGSALDEWHRMSLDEQRESHEKFARGFEAYLFDGKAPSFELQGPFQRFKSWLKNVYQSIKALNVTLTPEVSGVMDRMIASEQEIEAAEAAASMGLLFKTPEEAARFGLDWKAYQSLGNDATEKAIGELDARSLKDMQWLTGAKSRMLKRLQREAAEKRKDMRREVAAEIMGQPVYRAWAFLTGKDSGLLPEAPTEAEAQFALELKDWKANRAEYEVDALKTAKADAWEASDASKATYPTAQARGLAKGQFVNKQKARIALAVADEMAAWEKDNPQPIKPEVPPQQSQTETQYSAGKLSLPALKEAYGSKADATWRRLKDLRMTSEDGLAPDFVADVFGFRSGDEMVQSLVAAPTPREWIEERTDAAMLTRYGDISSPEALEEAANEAIHNDVRQRAVAAELAALEKAANPRQETGKTRRVKMPDGSVRTIRQTIATLPKAAKAFAEELIAGLRVRDIRVGQYSAAEKRAARASAQALAADDIAEAAEQKRNQLVNGYAVRAASDALAEAQAIRRYFKKFASAAVRKAITADYADRIEALLAKVNLSNQSNRAADRETSLRGWVQSRLDQGEVPAISESLLTPDERAAYERKINARDSATGELVYKDDEARIGVLADAIDASAKRPWRELTVEELRGLRDNIKAIEHLGRLKGEMLTNRDGKRFDEIRDAIVDAIVGNAANSGMNTPTATDWFGRKWQGIKQFGAAHIKSAIWARIFDGGKDGGPVWNYLIRPANERASFETERRAALVEKLDSIMRPILKKGPVADKVLSGKHFQSIGRALNWEGRFAMALNTGNASNMQRLLGGDGWTLAQIKPVLDTLTHDEWKAVQAIWDAFEEFRPEIAELERKLNGTEPKWIDPMPVVTKFGTFRGGYFPVRFDPRVNLQAQQHSSAQEAKEMMSAAYSAATTRRSFVKDRVEEVNGRPLLLTLQGMYSGFSDVIHDLAWREWLIDTNKILRSKPIDEAVREHYGPEVKREFEKWRDDIAAGSKRLDHAIERAAGWARQGVSAAGLTFNVMSAAMQPLGFTQTIARVGASWAAKGLARYVASPIESTKTANAKSPFMTSRARTRFRELNELRNQVQGQTAVREQLGRYGYWLMMRAQQMVDTPTWWAGYEKGIAGGHDEATAIALADQAVKDSQGGGEEVDQSGVERGGPLIKLFTTFYSFMNTAANLGYLSARTERSKAKIAVNMLLLYSIPAVLGVLFRDALTPGDSGDDDPEKLTKKLIAAQASYLVGLVAFGREIDQAVQAALGGGFGYRGPAGVRIFGDAYDLAVQAHQGEFDDSFRRAFVNLSGDLCSLPAAQINRSITGFEALQAGKTENPGALLTGYQEPR